MNSMEITLEVAVSRAQEWGDPLAVLCDGSVVDLSHFSDDQLAALQYDQERAFARTILGAPKGSIERLEKTGQAYDTVERIYRRQHERSDRPLTFGVDRRYVDLVCRLLKRQTRHFDPPRFFEVGFGTGVLLEAVCREGYRFAGLEVSTGMKQMAVQRIGEKYEDRLSVGNLLDFEPTERPTLIYWNDVFEHIAPDEILDYLEKLHDMLAPGGQLLTVTPNWHERPSDITSRFEKPRTEARGLHLKEYRLSEVATLLRQAGFRQVATPLLQIPGQQFGRIDFLGNGLIDLKCLGEKYLERLPFRITRRFSRLMGYSITRATR